MFRRAKFWISKVILIHILEMMISFKLVGSNLVPLCRQSFSMAMANQLHLLFKRKTKPFEMYLDLIQWDRKHLCFINASIWFSHWWSIVTFLLISCKQFKGSHEKCQDFSTWSRQAKQFGNLVVINYLEKGLNKKNISKWTNENSNLLHSQHPATSWFFVCLFVLGLGLDVSHVAHSLPFA